MNYLNNGMMEQLNGNTIMVIDDTPGNLELLENILTEKEYDVRLFPSGRLGLASALKDPPDLVLLDIMMPEMDGYQVCTEFKSKKKLADIPIIFLSAKSDTKGKLQAFETGGVDYITKPFNVDEVIARVSTHLGLRKLQKDLELKNKELGQTLKELANMQNQLIHTAKMASLGTLTAGIAHELNNPINAVNSSSISLERMIIKQLTKSCGDEKLLKDIKNLLSTIREGANRTTRIVNNLKSFAHHDQSEIKHVNINEKIESTLELLKYRTLNIINIEKDLGQLPPMECYPGKLNQVFMNILSNAIDAIEEKAEPDRTNNIYIHTRKKEKNIEIEIRDTGKGISKKEMEHIFEPFYTTKKIGRGTGLGLSISYGIIEAHSGKISIESEEKKGTSVTISIPLDMEKNLSL